MRTAWIDRTKWRSRSRTGNRRRISHFGFTLIELLLVIAIIGLIATIALVSQRNGQAKRRDVKRVSDTTELQKALALYLSKVQSYPVYTGCLTGSDAVSVGLQGQGFVSPGAKLVDPAFPTNITKCYYYVGTAGKYTLRYTLEQTAASTGAAGDHYIVP